MNKFWLILAIMCFLVLGSALASEDMQCIKANPYGEIVLDQPMMVGNTVMPAGKYMLHSDVAADGKHSIHFVEETKRMEVHPVTSEIVYSEHVAQVACGTELGKDIPSTTAVYYTQDASGMHLNRAVIKGEQHVHLF